MVEPWGTPKVICQRYNGSSTVDWCVAHCDLLSSILYFKVEKVTHYWDHCQITVAIISNTASYSRENSDQLHQGPMRVKWNQALSRQFPYVLENSDIKIKINDFLLDSGTAKV